MLETTLPFSFLRKWLYESEYKIKNLQKRDVQVAKGRGTHKCMYYVYINDTAVFYVVHKYNQITI